MKRIVLPLVIGFLLSPFILAQEEKTPPPRYNLILITIDTLRESASPEPTARYPSPFPPIPR